MKRGKILAHNAVISHQKVQRESSVTVPIGGSIGSSLVASEATYPSTISIPWKKTSLPSLSPPAIISDGITTKVDLYDIA
jgi:hypothetical protein